MVENLDAAQKEIVANQRQAALASALDAFKSMDANSDGELSRDEIKALLNSQKDKLPDGASEAKINEFFDQFDKDKDGKVQQSEWLGFFGDLFDSVLAESLAQ